MRDPRIPIPHVTVHDDEHGFEVVLEWWLGPHKVSLYVGGSETPPIQAIHTSDVGQESDETAGAGKTLMRWLTEFAGADTAAPTGSET